MKTWIELSNEFHTTNQWDVSPTFALSLQEINRSNRRIMKQTFVSDVLEISEPVKPIVNGNQTQKLTVDPETDDWDCKDIRRLG